MPRPKKTPDTAAMLEAAHLYYEKELSKQKIADRLRVDPREVTWLLSEARRLRLVRIDIPGLPENELADRVAEKFQLEKVLIAVGQRDRDKPLAPKTSDQYDAMLRNCGVLAADYFNQLADSAGTKPFHAGVSGGETVLEFVNAVQERERKNVHIYTTALIGGGGYRNPSRTFCLSLPPASYSANAGACRGIANTRRSAPTKAANPARKRGRWPKPSLKNWRASVPSGKLSRRWTDLTRRL